MVDTRHILVVVLSRLWRFLALTVLALLCLYFLAMSPPEGLSERGWRAIVIFSLCGVLWMTALIPLSITGILALILPPAVGILPSEEVYALFSNPAIFFILGAFMLAGAMLSVGLSHRFSLALLSCVGRDPTTLLLGVLYSSSFLAFWMPEHAVAAMMFPVVTGVVSVLELTPGSSYARGLYLAMAWGSVVGGVLTYLGGARAPLALGILSARTGQEVSFLGWMVATFPLVMIMLGTASLLILRYAEGVQSFEKVLNTLKTDRLKRGRMRFRESALAVVFAVTVLLWLLKGQHYGLANIALGAVVALFVLRIVRWREIEAYVNWGIILMYGGAITLGQTFATSGAGQWLCERHLMPLAHSPLLFLGALSLVVIALTSLVSNTTVVAVMLPVILGMGAEGYLSPVALSLAVAVPAGLAFCLPISTPPNAIAYSSGYLSLRDLVVPGLVMSVVGWGAFVLLSSTYWKWVGVV